MGGDQLVLLDEAAMVAFGAALADASEGHGVIYLLGDLGAGKTTLSRGVLRHLGFQGAVKSPTYTLVEPYELGHQSVYHFDLYRLGDPEELEFLGVRDYFGSDSLCLIEWPQRGEGVLPAPDLVLTIGVAEVGRHINLTPHNAHGLSILSRLQIQQEAD